MTDGHRLDIGATTTAQAIPESVSYPYLTQLNILALFYPLTLPI